MPSLSGPLHHASRGDSHDRANRMRRIVFGGLLISIGFFLGRCYGTFDIYRQASAGDYIDIPPELLPNMFEVGSVSVQYPGDWVVMATRRDPPTVTLSGSWSAGYLQIACNRRSPDRASGLLNSKFNPVGDQIELRDGERRSILNVSSSGDKNLILGPVAVNKMIHFMADNTFPSRVIVADRTSAEAMSTPLYHIPSIGVQNVYATMTGSGATTRPVPEPPSDPFKVMKRYCE